MRTAALTSRLDKAGITQAVDILQDVQAVPTIFPWIDIVLGISGWPIKRFGLVHGPSNKGKTALLLGLCLSFVKLGHPALFLDLERTTANSAQWVYDLMGEYARSPLFRIEKPASYEKAVELVRKFCTTIGNARRDIDPDVTGFIGVDSLRKLVPEKMLEQLMREFSDTSTQGKNDRKGIDGANGMAARIKAALNAQWADELTMLLDDTGTSLAAIAREYQKQKVNDWDIDYVLGGGSAMFFEASIDARIDESGRVLDADKQLIATEHSVSILKTKVGQKEERYPRAFFHLATGVEPGVPYGFDRARDVLHLAKHLGIIGDGAYFPFEDENLGHGEKNALNALRSNTELMQRIETKCRLAKMPKNAMVEVVTENGPVVAQEGPKTEPSPGKTTSAPRKRSEASKGQQKGKGKK